MHGEQSNNATLPDTLYCRRRLITPPLTKFAPHAKIPYLKLKPSLNTVQNCCAYYTPNGSTEAAASRSFFCACFSGLQLGQGSANFSSNGRSSINSAEPWSTVFKQQIHCVVTTFSNNSGTFQILNFPYFVLCRTSVAMLLFKLFVQRLNNWRNNLT